MALRATEGFDHYNSATDLGYRVGALQWVSYGSNPPQIYSPGRGGYGKCLELIGGAGVLNLGSGVVGTFSSNLATYFFGFALATLTPGSGVSDKLYVVLYDTVADSAQMTLVFQFATGNITVWRGQTGTLLGATPNNAFNAATFPFIEVGVTISGTAGVVTIQVNGEQVFSLTGANTQATANANFGALDFSAGAGTEGGSVLIDDFRYNDNTTGPDSYPNNSFMGDLRVATLFAISNASVSWTPLTGANWQEISETAFDGDTSYNTTSTNGNEDIFNLGSLASVISEVIAVQLVGGYREVDAGGHTLAQHLKVGGTDTAGTTQALSTSYQFITDLFPINPTSGASWLLSDVNALQIGYKAVS